jgi:hypothetical protein
MTDSKQHEEDYQPNYLDQFDYCEIPVITTAEWEYENDRDGSWGTEPATATSLKYHFLQEATWPMTPDEEVAEWISWCAGTFDADEYAAKRSSHDSSSRAALLLCDLQYQEPSLLARRAKRRQLAIEAAMKLLSTVTVSPADDRAHSATALAPIPFGKFKGQPHSVLKEYKNRKYVSWILEQPSLYRYIATMKYLRWR